MAVPKYDQMYNELLGALHTLGGSGSVQELEEEVSDLLKLTDEDINEIHRGNRTKFSYRLAWTRNYLKRFGLLENSRRGIWALTQKGLETKSVIKDEVNHFVKSRDSEQTDSTTGNNVEIEVDNENRWQDRLLSKLKSLDPAEFERLCQRVLREAGFIQLKVTGRSGDGGIDGVGIIKIAGFLGFRVIFQCKRYQGTVSSNEIREFKGTMVGRADKGLFITTGTFTRDARQEATRDGSTPIDLVDGLELVEKMRELNLGVKVTEDIEIDDSWFENF